MVRQFTPDSREFVRKKVEDMECVQVTAKCGPGLRVKHHAHRQQERTFTGLMESSGWYCASYCAHDDGDKLTLMPIDRVPVGGDS